MTCKHCTEKVGNGQHSATMLVGNSIERFMTVKDLADTIRVKESTLRDWIFKRQIPVVRIGRLVRFRWSEVEQWLRSGGEYGD